MCGRYTLCDPDKVGDELEKLTGERPADLRARYNVAPTQTNPVVKTTEAGKPVVASMRWGLVPFWDKSDKPKIAPINARSEEVVGKPMFRQSVQKRRCAVPADGFFEWKRIDDKIKVPHHIGLKDGAPFFIAGLYEVATEHRPETYALLTCGPNSLMEGIHDRMPVILTEETLAQWLSAGVMTPETVATICVPYQSAKMRAWPVSTLVNSPRNDVPECVVPVRTTSV